ncbi:STAS domain-containing protein [Amycolatopsis sp. lyj-90]|uniref:STAS domain-containing protein n=1 Tax=Amycolatopsis sp. lyj-90 TaxID=2789285 RepID=UPI0039791AB4
MSSSFQLPRELDNRHATRLLKATKPGDRLGFYAQPAPSQPTQVTEHAHTADLVILTVSGELDTVAAPLLRRNLHRPLPACTLIDLSRVTFLGVAGLRVLEAAAALARSERRRLGLVTAAPGVLRILRLFALDVRAPVYLRLADAMREVALERPSRHPSPFS